MIRSVFRTMVTLLTASLLPLVPLSLAGCGDDAASSGAPAPATATARNGEVFNTADVAFATTMVPLEAEALALVDLTADRELSAGARAVAEEIELTAPTEIEQMASWLDAWDRPVPATVRDHVNAGHDDGTAQGEGSDELERLAAADATSFEQLFLELIAQNHEKAVAACRTGATKGTAAVAVELARTSGDAHEQRAEKIDALLAGRDGSDQR